MKIVTYCKKCFISHDVEYISIIVITIVVLLVVYCEYI